MPLFWDFSHFDFDDHSLIVNKGCVSEKSMKGSKRMLLYQSQRSRC